MAWTSPYALAGTFTALYEPITDQSVAERLRACGGWVKALLGKVVVPPPPAELPPGLRFLVVDASTVQAPGATGTEHRLHICMDLVSLEFQEVLVSDVRGGESGFRFQPGDVVVADRGYAQAQGMQTASQQGADLIVRLNPFSVVLTTLTGQRLPALRAALQGQQAETVRTLPVVLGSAMANTKCGAGCSLSLKLGASQSGAPEMSAAPQERSAACGDPVARRLGACVYDPLPGRVTRPVALGGLPLFGKLRLRSNAGKVYWMWICGLKRRARWPRCGHGKLLYALLVERRMRRTLGADGDWIASGRARGGGSGACSKR